jgi:hypothetical protein
MALFDTAVVWLTYLGLEPYMRRYSPDSILGWTTLVSGRWRDPRVGVDVMIGLAAGLGMTILYAAHNLIPTLAGRVEPMPFGPSMDTLNGLRFIFAAIARQLSAALTSGLLGVAGIVGFVLLFKRPIAAGLAGVVCFTPVVISGMFPETRPLLDVAIGMGITAIFVVTILRAGLLSVIVALFTHFILLRAPITTDFSSWHAATGIWYVGLLLTVGLSACYFARYGEGERVTTS